MNEELEKEEGEEAGPSTPPIEGTEKLARDLWRFKTERGGGIWLDKETPLETEDLSKLSKAELLTNLKQGSFEVFNWPEELRDSEEFMLEAYQIKPAVLAFLGPNLKGSEDFFLKIAAINGRDVQYGAPEIQANQKVITKAAENWPQILTHTPLKDNLNFVRELAAVNPKILAYAPPEIRQKLKGAS